MSETIFVVERNPRGRFAVYDMDDDGKCVYDSGDRNQAEYYAMLREAGMDHDDADADAAFAQCAECGKEVFLGSLDAISRCSACAS